MPSRDQSGLQRAFEGLFRGLARGARNVQPFAEGQAKIKESKRLNLLDEEFRRARLGQSNRKAESALDNALLSRESAGVQARAAQRFAIGQGLTPEEARNFITGGGKIGGLTAIKREERLGLPKSPKESKPPQFKQAPDLSGKAVSSFGRAFERSLKGQGEEPNIFSFARESSRRVPELFRSNPQAFGNLSPQQASDSVQVETVNLLNQLLKQRGFEADLGSQETRDILTRPETVRGLPPLPGGINLKNLSDAELERLAKGQ